MGTRASPSKSCEPCRVKRRRCDLKRPHCSQCQRAGVTCPGYKDTFTLRLRDETVSTAHKVQLRESRSKVQSDRESTDNLPLRGSAKKGTHRQDACHSNQSIHVSPRESFEDGCKNKDHRMNVPNKPELPGPVTPTLPLDQAALSYFMNTYATHSSFHYFPEVYSTLMNNIKDATRPNKSDMDLAISIPALVLLSQELSQPTLLEIAHARYAIVLAVTQQALTVPKEAKSDSTLASVLLLGLVETLEFRGRRDPSGWDAHVLGAATLLQMRGTEQLESYLGRQLYYHAGANFKRRCALRSIRVPGWLIRLHKLTMQSTAAGTGREKNEESDESLFCRVSLVLEGLAALRADFDERGSSPSQWLERAVALSGDLDYVSIALRKYVPYQTVSVALSGTSDLIPVPCTYGNTFHIYSSPRAAKRWNDIRMLRLYLAEYMRDALRAAAIEAAASNIPSDSSPPRIPNAKQRLMQAIQIAEDASANILSSVPYTIHLSGAPRLMASSVVLPLSSVALSALLPDEMRMSARDSLRYIGTKFGNLQAMESLKMVQESDELETW